MVRCDGGRADLSPCIHGRPVFFITDRMFFNQLKFRQSRLLLSTCEGAGVLAHLDSDRWTGGETLRRITDPPDFTLSSLLLCLFLSLQRLFSRLQWLCLLHFFLIDRKQPCRLIPCPCTPFSTTLQSVTVFPSLSISNSEQGSKITQLWRICEKEVLSPVSLGLNFAESL